MTLPLAAEILLWMLGGFAYLAIGAVVIGLGDRHDPAYDYQETWWIWMLLWPCVLFAVLVVILCEWITAPLRWIYHRVRLHGRDKELGR